MNVTNYLTRHILRYDTIVATVATVAAFLLPLQSVVAASKDESGISVKLTPYVVGYVGSLPITATLLTAWLTMIILVAIAYFAGRKRSLIPGKLQNLFEMVVGGMYDYMSDTLESKKLARKYFPVIATIFFFVLFMNWIGLFPGVTSIGFFEGTGDDAHFTPLLYPAATDLNITIGLAIVAFVVIEFAGIAALGVWKYGGKFINFSGKTIGQRVLNFAIGLIELVSELARLVAFSFRLFGNIFAGKTLLVVIMALATPYVLPVPIIAYEIFVGFIQAFIFAILTLFFIKIAITEPH
ncbi:F0F1 ATP synthase subunit A [Candidatus Pacebacteria bacterium]|nr:F0F1 ATP synthase subunit A [Candidatus Paceibacterota bacterium]